MQLEYGLDLGSKALHHLEIVRNCPLFLYHIRNQAPLLRRKPCYEADIDGRVD